jgi:transcriptional regulator
VERLRTVVTELTQKHEAPFPAPWQVTDAPAVYIDSQLKAIVGFEFKILRLEGKRKFNQNRSVEDRIGVIEGLRELQEERKTKVADLMEEIESQRKSP